jgi:hypothetical protein
MSPWWPLYACARHGTHFWWVLFSCRPSAGTMELEDLYKRYCDRLKHSLFLNSLLIAAVGCAVSLSALCVFSPTVSMFRAVWRTLTGTCCCDCSQNCYHRGKILVWSGPINCCWPSLAQSFLLPGLSGLSDDSAPLFRNLSFKISVSYRKGTYTVLYVNVAWCGFGTWSRILQNMHGVVLAHDTKETHST